LAIRRLAICALADRFAALVGGSSRGDENNDKKTQDQASLNHRVLPCKTAAGP
jgi:hypothetical protein